MANIPKIQKELYPISLKLIQVSRIPLSIYKNIPYPFKFFPNVPVSLKTLPGLQWCRWGSNPFLDPWQSKKTNMHNQRINCYSDVRWSHNPWQPSDLMPSHRITRDSHQNSDSQAMTRNSHLQSSNRDNIWNLCRVIAWPVTVMYSNRMNLFRTHVQSSHDLDSHAQYSHDPNSYPVIAWPVTVVMKIHRLTRDSYCMTHDSLQNTYTVKTWTVSRAESSHQNACQYMGWRMHCKTNNSSEPMPIHRMTRTSNCMIRDSLPNSCLRITGNSHEGLDGVEWLVNNDPFYNE